MLRKDESVWIGKASSPFMLYLWRNLVALWRWNFRVMLFLISNASRNLRMQISPAHSKPKACFERFCNVPARLLITRTSAATLNLIQISWGLCIPREMHMNWGNLSNFLLKSLSLKNPMAAVPPYTSLEASAERTVSIPADVDMDDDIACHCCLVNNLKTSEKITKHIQNILHPELQQTLNSSWPQRMFHQSDFLRLLYGLRGNQLPKRVQEVKMCIRIEGHKYYTEKPEESCLCFSDRKTLIPWNHA